MKASFEYDLPDEQGIFSIHVHAVDIYRALLDADLTLRAYEKHSDGTIEEADRAISIARDTLSGAEALIDDN